MFKFKHLFTSWTIMLTIGFMVCGMAFADPQTPIDTEMSISVLPTSITPAGSATVTVTIEPVGGGIINCGKGKIQYKIVHADSTETDWLDLANNLPVANNEFLADFPGNSGAVVVVGDKVTFRAQYESTGSGCNYEGQDPAHSPTVDLMIVEDTTSAYCPNNQITGVYIAIVGPNGDGTPGPGQTVIASYNVRVTACEDVYDVTAQGGANGWSSVKSCTPYIGTSCDIRNKTKRNEVYLWSIGDLVAGQYVEATVTVEGQIKNTQGECGKAKYLNGDWSALYATEPFGTKTKSAYTVFDSYITVTCQ